MRVLVACEFSGAVRDAFRDQGHDAWSCDLLPSEGRTLGQRLPDLYPPGHSLHDFQEHYQCDVRELFEGRVAHSMWLENQGVDWDLMIAHPPCTHLAVSGARWFKERRGAQVEALAFVRWLLDAPVQRIALENPIGVISTAIRKPDQIIQPWQFGHGETKATCFWLKGLPPLRPTDIVAGRENRVHREPPHRNRWKNRSRTLPGIAAAMADQWGQPTASQAEGER
jgi:site-specific DNA-cytosine methylase